MVVAVSGSGRSLENLLKQQSKYAYRVCGVISSKANCNGVLIAKDAGLRVYCEDFSGGVFASDALLTWLIEVKAYWIALAGFVKQFPVSFPGNMSLRQRIINIHPSIIPSFSGKGMYGMRVHKAVECAQVRESGATIHFVDGGYDTGAIISQIKTKLIPGQNAELIAKQVFADELVLYPDTLSALVKKQLPLKDGTIYMYNK